MFVEQPLAKPVGPLIAHKEQVLPNILIPFYKTCVQKSYNQARRGLLVLNKSGTQLGSFRLWVRYIHLSKKDLSLALTLDLWGPLSLSRKQIRQNWAPGIGEICWGVKARHLIIRLGKSVTRGWPHPNCCSKTKQLFSLCKQSVHKNIDETCLMPISREVMFQWVLDIHASLIFMTKLTVLPFLLQCDYFECWLN